MATDENQYGSDNPLQDESSDDDMNEKKTKLLSKAEKPIHELRKHVREAVKLTKNKQFMDLSSELVEIDKVIKVYNRQFNRQTQMPKFFVKYMADTIARLETESKDLTNRLESIKTEMKSRGIGKRGKRKKNQENDVTVTKSAFSKLSDLQLKAENEELSALQRLTKDFSVSIPFHYQVEMFIKKPDLWSKGDSALEDAWMNDEEDDNDVDSEDFESDDNENDNDNDDGNEDNDDDDVDGGGNDNEDDNDNDNDNEYEDDEKEKKMIGNENEDDEDEDEGSDEWSDEDDLSDADDKRGRTRGDEADGDDDDGSQHGSEDGTGTGAGATSGASGAVTGAFTQEQLAKMKHRSFWVKKDKSKNEKKIRIRNKPKGDVTGTQTPTAAASTVDTPTVKQEPKWTAEKVRIVYTDVMTNRGRMGVDREDIIKRLNLLIDQCKLHNSEQARLTCVSALVSFYFDSSMRKQAGMTRHRWLLCRDLILDLLTTLTDNGNYRMSSYADMQLNLKEDDNTDGNNKNSGKDDELEKQQRMFLMALNAENNLDDGDIGDTDGTGVKKDDIVDNIAFVGSMGKGGTKLDSKYIWINGNLWGYIHQLRTQLWINLKSIPPRTKQYEQRLRDSKPMIHLLKYAWKYYETLNLKNVQAAIYTEIMSLTYCDYSKKYDYLFNESNKEEDFVLIDAPNKSQLSFGSKSILNLPNCEIVRLAKFVFRYGDKKMQTKAMLYLIYNLALHNQYELCRDLILMSHLANKNKIANANVDLQILYNRTLAQFAICAFSQGNWFQTMLILQELYANGKLRVLLAQGVITSRNPTIEQEKQTELQRARQLPNHLHINTDLLDAAHLISSVFSEVPTMVVLQTNGMGVFNNKNKLKNKHFRKKWEQYMRRDMRMPPENTEGIVLTTGINMMDGKYFECAKLIKKLKIWNELVHSKYILNKVKDKLKRECMKCYLHRFGAVYDSISIKKLSKMFQLSENECKEYLGKMIVSRGEERLHASLDEMSDCLIIHHVPPTQLQRVALEFGDRLAIFSEQNAKLLGGSAYATWVRGKERGGDRDNSKVDQSGDNKDGGSRFDRTMGDGDENNEENVGVIGNDASGKGNTQGNNNDQNKNDRRSNYGNENRGQRMNRGGRGGYNRLQSNRGSSGSQINVARPNRQREGHPTSFRSIVT